MINETEEIWEMREYFENQAKQEKQQVKKEARDRGFKKLA